MELPELSAKDVAARARQAFLDRRDRRLSRFSRSPMPDTTLPAPTLPTLLTSDPRALEEIVPKYGPITYGKSSLLLHAVRRSSKVRDVELVAKSVEEGDVGYKTNAMLLKETCSPLLPDDVFASVIKFLS